MKKKIELSIYILFSENVSKIVFFEESLFLIRTERFRKRNIKQINIYTVDIREMFFVKCRVKINER